MISTEAGYETPEMAFGLHLWREPLPETVVNRPLAEYDAFYAELAHVLDTMLEHHRRLVVLDLHAYKYRREGPDAPPAPEQSNPEINVGTGNLDRQRYALHR